MTAGAANGDAAEPYVIDASAAYEYLRQTPTGLLVAGLIADARLIAPQMLDAEVLSVLRFAVLGGNLTEAEALAILDDLAAWEVERVSHQTIIRTAWQYRHNVSAYDALYVAVAQAYNATLLTCDGHLSRAPALGVAVRNVGLR